MSERHECKGCGCIELEIYMDFIVTDSYKDEGHWMCHACQEYFEDEDNEQK